MKHIYNPLKSFQLFFLVFTSLIYSSSDFNRAHLSAAKITNKIKTIVYSSYEDLKY